MTWDAVILQLAEIWNPDDCPPRRMSKPKRMNIYKCIHKYEENVYVCICMYVYVCMYICM